MRFPSFMKTLLPLILAPSALAIFVAGCGGEAQTAPPPPPPTTAQPPPPPPPPEVVPPHRPEAGHNLAILATACWFGGVWGDAEGDSPDTRKQASEARCHDVVRRVYENDDKGRYEQLRALEPTVVGDIAAKVETLAKEDTDDAPRSRTLAELVQAVAGAQREAMLARRAATRVRRDLDHEPDKLSDDEAAAVPQLIDTRNLQALLKLEAQDITHDAHVLGVLAALERVQTGEDLPKHIKIYALQGANETLFGVKPPDLPNDATKKLKPGTWLAYVTEVAKAAGHPVPDTVKGAKQREPLAWAGMLYGYADKLRADMAHLAPDTRLDHVASVVSNRLEAEYKAVLNALTGPPAEKNAKPAPKKPKPSK
jgi:hypothetical protein